MTTKLIPANNQHYRWIMGELTPDMCQTLNRRPLLTLGQTSDYVRNSDGKQPNRFVVSHPLLGNIGLVSWGVENIPDQRAEISYWISRSYRNQGYGKLATQLLISMLETQGFRRIVADIFPENEASISMIASMGFIRIGPSPNPIFDRYLMATNSTDSRNL